MSWDGRRNVYLWIIKTNAGTKRTWKATEAEARTATEARGWKVKSIRAGVDADALINAPWPNNAICKSHENEPQKKL